MKEQILDSLTLISTKITELKTARRCLRKILNDMENFNREWNDMFPTDNYEDYLTAYNEEIIQKKNELKRLKKLLKDYESVECIFNETT